MYSWQVKFNNEIIYYRHVTYYIGSVNLTWLFFCLGIPKKIKEHDIMTLSLLHVNNRDLALGIGN